MNLSLSLTDNLGLSHSSGVVDNGVEIVNHANTTVTPTAGQGYTVERTTGGGAWDASGISLEGLTDDWSMVIHRTVGDCNAGVNFGDPAASDNYDFLGWKFHWQTGVLYIFQSGTSLGTTPLKDHAKIEYIVATDTMNFYTSDDGLAWGAAVMTLNPGLGAKTWKVDSSLFTAGAKFTAKFQ